MTFENTTEPPASFLIGIGGNGYGSGKDSVADNLIADHGFIKIAMSDPVAAALYEQNPWIRLDQADGTPRQIFRGQARPPKQFAKYRDLVDMHGYTRAKEQSEVRAALQALGTEVGRNMLGEDVWINIALHTVAEAQSKGAAVSITGIRYRNEADRIREHGGYLVYVKRPGLQPTAHSSENTLGEEDFDLLIENTGSLHDLALLTTEAAVYFGKKYHA